MEEIQIQTLDAIERCAQSADCTVHSARVKARVRSRVRFMVNVRITVRSGVVLGLGLGLGRDPLYAKSNRPIAQITRSRLTQI